MTAELRAIEAMFESLRATSDWNIDGPCLWGYFFVDPDADKLEAATLELQSLGYRVVELFELEADDEDRPDAAGSHCLHVEKVEAHTPQSLLRRNEQLRAFADAHGLADYDGMDVGPAPVA